MLVKADGLAVAVVVVILDEDRVLAGLVAETEGRKVLLPAVDLFKVELDWNLEAEL